MRSQETGLMAGKQDGKSARPLWASAPPIAAPAATAAPIPLLVRHPSYRPHRPA